MKQDIALMMAGAMCLAQMAGLDVRSVGLYDGCPWWHALTWMWCHGGWVHYIVNTWVWLTIVFLWDGVRLRDMVAAVAAAMVYGLVAVGWDMAGDKAVVGLSGVIYALLGMCSMRPRTMAGKLRYNGLVALWIVIGCVMPGVAGAVHIGCYVAGAVWALMNHRWIKIR